MKVGETTLNICGIRNKAKFMPLTIKISLPGIKYWQKIIPAEQDFSLS
jgi:hypothetical protein